MDTTIEDEIKTVITTKNSFFPLGKEEGEKNLGSARNEGGPSSLPVWDD